MNEFFNSKFMKKTIVLIISALMLIAILTGCRENITENREEQISPKSSEEQTSPRSSEPASVGETVSDTNKSERDPLWLQGSGTSFEIQVSTKLVSDVKSNSDKAMYVNFIRADESYKMVLTILYTDGEYSGYISKNETGEVFDGDLVFVREDFINFRFDSKYYSEFADIKSYQVFLSGGDIGVPYPFENCAGGEFTPQNDSTSADETTGDNADTLPMVGNTYKQPNGATLQIVHSNSDGCITAIKLDDILLELTNAQFMPDYEIGKDAYIGDFDNGLKTFSTFYNKSKDSFDVWFTVLSSELWDGRTPMKFDAERFMGTYTIESYGNNHSGSSIQSSYSFIGVTFKNEDLDLTFKLQSPDSNGYPTEIVLNGVTYSDDVTFNNETFTLKNVTITTEFSNCYSISANWSAKGLEFSLSMDGDKGWWKMYGPAMCSGYYYPK